MLPKRRLLYDRGIDNSVGTYVTDYVLVAECIVLFGILVFQYSKKDPLVKKALTRTTIAVIALLGLIGLVALIAGLTHHYLQTVEPYRDWRDAWGWLIVWRLGGTVSGLVALCFFALTESLLKSENLLKMSPYAEIAYYTVALLCCIGLAGHSIWLIFDSHDPWTLTVTFAVLFFIAFLETIVALFVLIKRFRSHEEMELFDGVNLNGRQDSKIEHSLPARRDVELTALKHTRKRWDLLLHFLASFIFIAGGIFQLVLAKFFNCGAPPDPEMHGCPLPNSFNHNSVLHLLQMLSMALYFAAEFVAIRRRIRLRINF